VRHFGISFKISIPASGRYLLSFWSWNNFSAVYNPNLDKRNTVLISKGSNDPESDDFEPVWSPEKVDNKRKFPTFVLVLQ
jgi:hypothetical protein